MDPFCPRGFTTFFAECVYAAFYRKLRKTLQTHIKNVVKTLAAAFYLSPGEADLFSLADIVHNSLSSMKRLMNKMDLNDIFISASLCAGCWYYSTRVNPLDTTAPVILPKRIAPSFWAIYFLTDETEKFFID